MVSISKGGRRLAQTTGRKKSSQMPYISLDDAVEVDVEVEVTDITVNTGEVYFDIDAHDIDGLDDYIREEVKSQLDDRQEVVDARTVAVEILRMLAELLELKG